MQQIRLGVETGGRCQLTLHAVFRQAGRQEAPESRTVIKSQRSSQAVVGFPVDTHRAGRRVGESGLPDRRSGLQQASGRVQRPRVRAQPLPAPDLEAAVARVQVNT